MRTGLAAVAVFAVQLLTALPAWPQHAFGAEFEAWKPHDPSRDNPRARAVVPDHKAIRPGTLHQILKAAGLSVDDL